MKNSNIFKDIIVPFQDSELSVDDFIRYRKLIGEREIVSYILGIKDNEVLSRFERGETMMLPSTITLFLLISGIHPVYELQEIDKCFMAKALLISAPVKNKLRKQKRHNVGLMTGEKLSQGAMAELLGLTGKSLISKYENGERNPSIQTWTIFLLSTNQHPFFKLVKRRDRTIE